MLNEDKGGETERLFPLKFSRLHGLLFGPLLIFVCICESEIENRG